MLTRIVFGWIFLTLIYQASASLMISQLEAPILIKIDLDISYWLIHLMRIPSTLVNHFWLAMTFDIMLMLGCLLVVIFPKKNIFSVGTTILFFIHATTLNSYMCWHYDNLIPLILLLIPFCFKSLKTFSVLFAGLRYSVLYIYASAALWKLFRGSIFNTDQMIWMIEHNYAEKLADRNYELSFFERMITSLLHYPQLAAVLLFTGVLLQALFIIGFFTKRFDIALIVTAVVFHLGTSVLVDVSFIQLWILMIALLPFAKIAKRLKLENPISIA